MHVSEYLSQFNGPVTIVRRNRDEIMQKNPSNTVENRANFLLINLLNQRYPHLLTKTTRETLWRGMKMTNTSQWREWLGKFYFENNF